MSQQEYEDLIQQFGLDMTKQLIEQLDLYKQAKGKNYDNDYSAILRWVTTRIREIEKEQDNYKKFKEKQKIRSPNNYKYEQRDYSDNDLSSLYCNLRK